MARKRLSGPLPDYLDGGPAAPAPAASRVPIAQIAGDTAALNALAAVSSELEAARSGGRMVLALPLEAVVTDYLIRDRIEAEPGEMAALKDSLRARGQQMPVEVAEIAAGRYGLISGWRRVLALSALHAETGEARFAEVLALVRRPEVASDAYVAMVEENEIRAGLSFYERARIVIRAVEAGIYPSEKKALQGLFATASHAKRSKVKSFIPVVTELDGGLRFPARISERTGLALSKRIGTDAGFAARAVAVLHAAAPQSAEAEAEVIARLLREGPIERPTEGPTERPAEGDAGAQMAGDASVPESGDAPQDPENPAIESEFHISGGPGRIVVEGAGVDEEFVENLIAWLMARAEKRL